MIIRIIEPHGDLKREVWDFLVTIGLFHDSPVDSIEVHFDEYNYQTRKTTIRRIWSIEKEWDRIDTNKLNNIKRPSVPPEVEKQLRERLHKIVDETEIK